MALTPDRYLSSLRSDSAALAAAARDNLHAPVPWCGDWTVRELVEHVGLVHQRVREVVRLRSDRRISDKELPPPPAGGTIEWFAEGAARLADTLEAVGTESPAWNWTGADQTAAFWHRRMAQETLVHRWDAEKAAGVDPITVDHDMGVDGVDELVDAFLPLLFMRGPQEGLTGSLHLHATDGGDGEGEWWVGLSPTGAEVRHEHAKGDVAVRGPAAELLLLVWNRRPADGLEVFGDTAVLDRWEKYARF